MPNKKDSGFDRKREDYATVFATNDGERVIADLVSTFHLGRSTHIPGDSHETAFREGQRNVVLHILDLMGKRSSPEWLNDKLDQGEIEYSMVQEFNHA